MSAIRLVVAAVVAIAAVAMVPSVAHACSCVESKPPQEAVADFPVVFAGTVTATDDVGAGAPIRSDADQIRYTFHVDAIAKGDIDHSVDVSSPRFSASCGVTFREGKRYLVFAYRGDGVARTGESRDPLFTNSCTPTMKVSPGQALPISARDVSDRGGEPGPASDAPEGRWSDVLPLAAVAVGALAVATLLWVRRAR